MKSKSLLLRPVFTAGLIVLLSILAFADTIRLKDGSTVKGRITGFRNGKFTIVVGEGQRQREFTFEADEIEFIEFDKLDRATQETVGRRTPVNDVPAIDKKVAADVQEANTLPTTTVTRPVFNASAMKPIILNINVTADDTANGWTNSGWVVRKGQKIRIVGEGEVSLGKGQRSGPSGSYTLEDESKLLKSVPTGALIAVIGDDNNDFIYIGSDREFVATRDGTLFLGINEGDLKDNSGSFKVTIEIFTDR